jgi:3-dehydroquinate synthase
MPETLGVHLGDRSYTILFGGDLTAELCELAGELAGGGRGLAVLTDANVARDQASTLRRVFGDGPLRAVPAGEDSKSVAEFGRVLDFLADQGLGRSAVLFAVGGGVVGDLAGFAAASYLRGIDYYQVPTTLLAMVDSSVGGKTGINLAAGKNLAGAFHQPRGVFIATRFLVTLPDREFAAGMAEVIKTGLLGDGDLFAQLEGPPMSAEDPRLVSVIRRCCAVKARVVEADERETASEGGRALLNLGHTFAHAIEQAAGYGTYLHGEAVAIGLCAAAGLSRALGMITEREAARVEAAVKAYRLPSRLVNPLPLSRLLAAMSRDKKVRLGTPRFILLKSLGQAVVRSDVPREAVDAAWRSAGAT